MKMVKKSLLLVLLIMGMLFTCLVPSKDTKADTSENANEKVEKLNKEIKELEEKIKKEEEGTDIIYGDILCSDPLIVKHTLFGSGYYWIKDTTYINFGLLGTATGVGGCTIRKTGNYRTWNGITCIECVSVDTSKVKEYKQKINEKKAQIESYSAYFKYVILDSEHVDLKVGKKTTLKVYLSENKYNKVKWNSSDKSIVKVSSKGIVKAVAPGTATVTATASVSGATHSFIITVKEKKKTSYSTIKIGNTTFSINQEWKLSDNDNLEDAVEYFYDNGLIGFSAISNQNSSVKTPATKKEMKKVFKEFVNNMNLLDNGLDMEMKVKQKDGVYYGKLTGKKYNGIVYYPYVLYMKVQNNTYIITYIYDYSGYGTRLSDAADKLAFNMCKQAEN